MKTTLLKTAGVLMLTAALFFPAISVSAAGVGSDSPNDASFTVYDTKGSKVTNHSIQAIKGFISVNGTSKSQLQGKRITMAQEPNTSAPYEPIGSVSTESMGDFLKLVNTVRYIAGLNYNVKLDSELNNYAQAGAMVNFAGGESLSHEPKHPAGMSQDIYDAGYTGANKSNLAYGYSSVWDVITRGWMNDGDSGNISMVGHRRWILSPQMGKTGIGYVGKGNYSAMYVLDKSNTEAEETHIAWPAANMPLDYFSADYPWSITFGEELSASTQVNLVHKNTGKTWSFSSSSSDGEFYINNDNRGQKGAVIFRPKGISSYSHGDAFEVTVTGNGIGEYSYTVTFYDLDKVKGIDDDFSIDRTKDGVAMFRLYNPTTGEHFYTGDTSERSMLSDLGWKYEGYAWTAPNYSQTPVYRLSNPLTGDHHYTTDIGEKTFLIASGWNDENIGWYSDDNMRSPLYRLNNPNLTTGNHHYTKSINEKNALTASGWNDEGIGWYGL